jgi:uncharacterized membrane protein
MHHWLLPFFRWTDHSWLSEEIRASTWQFAVLEMIHLIGLAILLGTVVILDLRLLGYGMRKLRVAHLARELAPWNWVGLGLIFGSGIFLYFGEPMKLFGSPAFSVKMVFFFLAVIYQLTVFRRATLANSAGPEPPRRLLALFSLALWFGAGLAGRGIGFL